MQRALANQAFRSITRSSSLLAHPGMSELASIWTPAARSILGSCPYTPKFPVRRRHDCHSPRDTGQNRTKEKQEESKPPKRPLFERAKRGWFTAGEVLITILLVLVTCLEFYDTIDGIRVYMDERQKEDNGKGKKKK